VALELADSGYSPGLLKALKGGIVRWFELGYPIE
jgi:hypothetical protein